jgi:hypothetical protein
LNGLAKEPQVLTKKISIFVTQTSYTMDNGKRYGIDDLKKAIAGKTKAEKILAITQAQDNYRQNISSLGNGHIHQVYEWDYETLVAQLLQEVEADTSDFYDRDWNWFFNADNIPNQNAVFATKEFLDKRRSDHWDPLHFFNLLFRQIDELKDHLTKPIDFVAKLKAIPLSDIQRHTLFGMLLYWHGGYPVNNLDPKYNTILKLIEREFFATFPEDRTPEKEFCATPVEAAKRLKEAGAHIHAALRSSPTFTESRYFNHVMVDFEDLPQYVIQRGIVWPFESERLHKDSDFTEWQQKYIEFLRTIPATHIAKTLQKGVEYAKKVYHYHLDNECTNAATCPLNQSWERRIAMTEQILQELAKATGEEDSQLAEEKEGKNKSFTTARQVLAVHYLLKSLGINPVDAPVPVAEFVQFLTGREVNAKRIQDSTLYKKVASPFKLNDAALKKDLEFIMPFFKKIGLEAIVTDIEREIIHCTPAT